ncbi:hypothetical protein [Massilia sp. S19_KUP03_FR1]|uniref:hypothetical protein n=1 Tax=Massilia sp. S19_KUP03_FR1 TaxID=3025503 RepID=UPI002FCCC7DC
MATNKTIRPPTGHIAPFGLRLQPDLKAQAEQSAARAGRSLNSEIVHVLSDHYQRQAISDRLVDSELGYLGENPSAEYESSSSPELPELRLTLDAGDEPICWDEIHEYIRAIRKTMNVNDVRLSITVNAGAHVSSNERESQTDTLAKKLRSKKLR